MFIELDKFNDESIFSIAIFVAKTRYGNNHTGILIKNGSEIKLYHLAWHFKFQCDNFEQLLLDSNFVIKRWVKFSSLTSDPILAEYRLPTIIKLIELIYRKNFDKIPYGINFRTTRFTTENDLLLGEGENGLTCATFVSSLFERASISLVDLSTWTFDEEDTEWKRSVISSLRHFGASEDHIRNIENEDFNFRLKPEEIATASSKPMEELPANYSYCSEVGSAFNSIQND